MTTPFPIPLAPATRDELFQRHGIVAVFLPSGKAAVEGFSDLVDQILLAPSKHKPTLDSQCIFLHHREKRALEDIIAIGSGFFLPDDASGRAEGGSRNAMDQDDLADASDTTYTSTISAEPNQLWHGFVGISLNHRLEAPRFGWSVGYQPTWPEFTSALSILTSRQRSISTGQLEAFPGLW